MNNDKDSYTISYIIQCGKITLRKPHINPIKTDETK